MTTKHVAGAVRELPLESSLLPTNPLPRWRMAAWSVGLATLMTAITVSALGWYRGTAVPAAQSGVNAITTANTVVPASIVAAPTPASSAAAVSPSPTSPTSRPESPAATMTGVSPAVKPGGLGIDSTKLNAVLARTRVWLREADPGGYTIQLAALPSTQGLDAYLAQAAAQLDVSKVYAQYSVYKGKTYVSVYLGNYDSHRAAALAIEALPTSLRSNRPLVRTWTKIKQDQQP